MPRYLMKLNKSNEQYRVNIPKKVIAEAQFQDVEWVTLEAKGIQGILIRPLIRERDLEHRISGHTPDPD